MCNLSDNLKDRFTDLCSQMFDIDDLYTTMMDSIELRTSNCEEYSHINPIAKLLQEKIKSVTKEFRALYEEFF